MPPSAQDELVKALGDKITVQSSDWNCGSLFTPNQKRENRSTIPVSAGR